MSKSLHALLSAFVLCCLLSTDARAAHVLFSNNATTQLAAGIPASGAGSTSATLNSGTGVKFPVITTAGQHFRATLVKAGDATVFEIVDVSATSGDVMTIARAQEGTTARAWTTGDSFSILVTAGDMASFVQPDDLQAGATNWAVDSGAANAYVVALTPALTAHLTGAPIRWKAAHANTGASTFTDGIGAASLVTANGAALVAGDIAAGGIYESTWDGSVFRLVSVQRPAFSQVSGTVGTSQLSGTYPISISGTAATIAVTASSTNASYALALLPGSPSATVYTNSITGNPATGVVTASGFNSTSDETVKHDIVPIADSDRILDGLAGVRWAWNDSSGRSAGVLAQQVKAVLPECTGTTNAGKLTVNYNCLTGVLIAQANERRAEAQWMREAIAALATWCMLLSITVWGRARR